MRRVILFIGMLLLASVSPLVAADAVAYSGDNAQDSVIVPDDERVLGDIYISIDKAKLQAEEFGHSLLRELSFLAVHGFYHLLGYDHQTKEEEEIMFKKQEEVLDAFKITRETI